MIRLAKSTYARVRKSVEQVGLCDQLDHPSDQCHICLQNVLDMLKWLMKGQLGRWCLCDAHKREVGVLW